MTLEGGGKEKNSFSFVDKRHRGGEEEEPQKEQATPPAEPAGEDRSSQASRDFDEAVDSQSAEMGEDEELKAPPIDFSTFVLSLASNAVYSLGGFQDPVSGKTSINLGQAKQAIDILSMIEEKTSGNLDNEEARLIQHLLYDLRMKFVEATKK